MRHILIPCTVKLSTLPLTNVEKVELVSRTRNWLAVLKACRNLQGCTCVHTRSLERNDYYCDTLEQRSTLDILLFTPILDRIFPSGIRGLVCSLLVNLNHTWLLCVASHKTIHINMIKVFDIIGTCTVWSSCRVKINWFIVHCLVIYDNTRFAFYYQSLHNICLRTLFLHLHTKACLSKQQLSQYTNQIKPGIFTNTHSGRILLGFWQ